MLKHLFLSLIYLVLCHTAIAATPAFEAGKDYLILPANLPHQKTTQPILVDEYFSYGCPWCYRLEKPLAQWVSKQGKRIDFKQIPVIFNPKWEYYAKAYYLIDSVGKTKQLSSSLFKAILDDKQLLTSNQAMIDFFVHHGVDKSLAESAFNHSVTMDMQLNQSKEAMINHQINAIPALVIDNHYKTDLQMAKTPERLLAILDYLLMLNKKS